MLGEDGEHTETKSNEISRRNFLASTGVVGATTTLSKYTEILGEEKVTTTEQVETWDRETEVLIVGSGGAGMCAAIEASENDAQVEVIDKAARLGGDTRHSGGVIYLGGGTSVQNELGVDDSVEKMFAYTKARHTPETDEARIRKFCEESPGHYDWLEERGVPFFKKRARQGLYFAGAEKLWPYRTITEPLPRGNQVEGGGEALWGALHQSAVDAGATITKSTEVVKLVVDHEKNRVVGVQTADDDDGSRQIKATNAIIVATGGFESNDDMIEDYLPKWADKPPISRSGTHDGSGILMGMSIGASVKNMDGHSGVFYTYPPKSLLDGILINKEGQRFTNEDTHVEVLPNKIVADQTDETVYMIIDEPIAKDVREVAEDMQNITTTRDFSRIAKAETIEDLASTLADQEDVQANILVSTFQSYNKDIGQENKDVVYHKHPDHVRPLDTPPYYALKATQDDTWYFTWGGLQVDTKQRVLDPYGDPINGLLAAGRACTGTASQTYDAGMSLADVTLWGRVAGRTAIGMTDEQTTTKTADQG
jgi:3-oxo-5alpha-steroid 4-dehydrogenase